MNILYLTYNSVLTLGILQSQVAILLKLLSAKYPNDLRFTLITVERWKDYRNKSLKTAFRQEMEQDGIRVIIVPKLLPEFLRIATAKTTLWQQLWSNIIFLYDFVLLLIITGYVILRYRIKIIHARSYVPGIIGLFFKRLFRKRFIFDPRGLIPEELLLAQGWSITSRKYRAWKRIEKWLLKGADNVFVLSRPFAVHYQKIIPNLDPIITPCCVDTDKFIYNETKRVELRRKLGLSDSLVVVVTIGSFAPYQLLDGGIKLFQQILKLHSNARLLILTPDKQQIQIYLPKFSDLEMRILDLIEIYSPSFAEMPDYLLASDLALLVRIPSVISEVASPVKFAEYLASGVPVIAYPKIGDTQQIIEQYQVGIIIDLIDDTTTEQKLAQLLPKLDDKTTLATRCRTTAISHLTWDNYLDLYYKIYNSIS